MKKNSMLKVIFPILLGNMIEFYDIVLFGIFAPILSIHFYNLAGGVVSALSLSYITFAVGFFFRPLGSIYFGYIADMHGRKKALLISMLLMAISTLGIALSPGYSQIGIFATILVTIFRAIQGLSAGGEYNNAAIYLIEYNDKHKNITSALLVASGVIGSLLATNFYNIIMLQGMPSWLWRVAFGLGSSIAIIALFLRWHLLETKQFFQIKKRSKIITSPIAILFSRNKKELLISFIIGGFNGLIYYYQFIFLTNYFYKMSFISIIKSNYITMLALVCYGIGVIGNGFIANKYGAKKLMSFTCIAYICLLIPLTEILFEPNLIYLLIYQVILAFLNSCYCGVKHVYLAGLFATEIRSSGVSLGYGFGVAVFGGTAPFFLNILSTYGTQYITIYITLLAASCLLTLKLEKTKISP